MEAVCATGRDLYYSVGILFPYQHTFHVMLFQVSGYVSVEVEDPMVVVPFGVRIIAWVAMVFGINSTRDEVTRGEIKPSTIFPPECILQY